MRSTLIAVEKPSLDQLSARARHGFGARRVLDHAEHRLAERLRVLRRHEQPCLSVSDQLRYAFESGADHRCLHGERLTQRAGEPEPGIGGIHDKVTARQDLRDVLAVAEDEDHALEAALARLRERLRDAGRGRADEEQSALRGRPVHADHGVEHVVIAAPGAHADLRDELMTRLEAELGADAAAVDARMKAAEIGAGVDHLDLRGRHAGRDEATLDRLADGHDGGDPPVRVPETVPAIEGKAHPAIQDQHGDLDQRVRRAARASAPCLSGSARLRLGGSGSVGQAPTRRGGRPRCASGWPRGESPRARTAPPTPHSDVCPPRPDARARGVPTRGPGAEWPPR